ncbi:hypothetical protein M4D48_11755 [Alkalihalobacillus clausii]|uniref:hypothetical protein n=1 Tax=Shouchella clausii TaxID=79880 RepID=UPI000BA54D20|nr:hypothetical protein [Shouchella clausii]MCM3549245.1 hypothetical protein [Shouchella clausii]PAF14010.1 hypothetical protein CHH59_11195 [Shouchella clausii]
MKRKSIILLTIVGIIGLCIGIIFYVWNANQKEKEAANYALYAEYYNASDVLHLDMYTREYERTGNPHDIELTPTHLTYDLLQRWEAITEVIPMIDYPEEAIELEDWLNVYNTFASNRFDAEDASKEITKRGGSETTNSMAINDYLLYGSVYNDYFREFLEENGIEGPDRRRWE